MSGAQKSEAQMSGAQMSEHLPGTFARAKELHLDYAEPASIPAYLDWLCAPLDFEVHGPRFLKIDVNSETIVAIIDAVRQQFMAATTPATFVIVLDLDWCDHVKPLKEPTVQNATTKEQLTVRNARVSLDNNLLQVEITRHPIGADAKMREWIEQRGPDYDHKQKNCYYFDEAEQVIAIDGTLIIGDITEKDGIDQAEDEATDGDQDEAGPSTSAKGMKKK